MQQLKQTGRHFLFIYGCACLTVLLLSTSCASRRVETYPAETASIRILSQQYGIQITSKDNQALYHAVAQWLGTPYRNGHSVIRRGTDCSGFVFNIYRSVYGKNLARSSADMLRTNCIRIGRQKLREGDLVFFATGRNLKKVTHVGIYLKDNKFAHASTSQGVTISHLNEPYYRRRWVAGGVVR